MLVSWADYSGNDDARPDVAVPVADPRRHRVRALRLRQEAGTLAAAGRGPGVHGLFVLHAVRPDARRRRRADRCGIVDGNPARLVILRRRVRDSAPQGTEPCAVGYGALRCRVRGPAP